MRLPRIRRLWIVIAAVTLVVGGVVLVVLPIAVRHVLVTQLTKATGRAVTLDDVDLNPFTRHLALKGFRLAQKDSAEAAVAFDRVDVRIALLPLVLGHARITELTVQAPTLRVTRLGPDTFDFADLLPPRAETPREPAPPSRWTMTLDRLVVRQLMVIARDRVVAPPAEWKVAGISFDATHLTTRTDTGPGRLTFTARINDTPFTLEASGLELATRVVTARIALDAFPLASVAPYLPPTVGAVPRAGTLTLAVTAVLPREGAPFVIGDVAVNGLEVVRRDGGARVVSLPRLAVAIERADLGARTVTLASVEIDKPALDARRSADGAIDILRLVEPAPATAAPAASPAVAKPVAASQTADQPVAAAAPTDSPPLRVSVKQVKLNDAELTFVDEAVKPTTTLRLSRLTAGVRDVTWPTTGPAAFEMATGLPGAGRVSLKGSVTPTPLDADVTVSLRDGSIAPYGAYFPFKARFAGAFNADARWRVRLARGVLTATSHGGNSWIDGLSVRDSDAPAAAPPLVRSERLRLETIDFAWPKYARVKRVTITKPDVRVERDKDGAISIHRIFTAQAPAGTAPSAAPSPSAPPPAASADDAPKRASDPKPLPVELDIGAIVVERGFGHFADRTVEPAFTETISDLAVSVEGLSSTPGRRAKLNSRAIVGGNAPLKVSGELAPLGRMYADVTLELGDFELPTVTPYVDRLIAWKISNGKLLAKLHYSLDGDALRAENAVTLGNLEMTRSEAEDRAQRRLGLPLGLIIALIKDGDGRIVLNVPLTGSLSDPKFDLSETIWTAIRNVIVNVAAAPFRAIGRLVTADDNKIERLAVDPVIFDAGSATIAPPMEQHVLRVAAFLKGAPAITLTAAPVTSARDVDSLKVQELTARLAELQRARKLKDYPAAVAAGFRARFPEVKKVPPTEEAFARLLEGEPSPDARVEELRARRVQAVRDMLAGPGGVPAARVSAADAGGDAGEQGRVDFRVGN